MSYDATDSKEISVPDFIQPRDIRSYSDEELEALLEGIRFRRMQAAVVYSKTQEVKELAARVKLEAVIEKKLEKLAKKMQVVDKALEGMEKALNEVRAFRLQLGEEEI